MMSINNRKRAAVGLVASWLLLGCTGDAADDRQADYAVELMRDRLDAVSGASAYQSLTEAMPNVVYRATDGVADAASTSVVLGQFDSAVPGRGFHATEANGEEVVQQTEFDDPIAEWVTVHVRFIQRENIAGEDLSDDGLLTVGFALPAGVDAIEFGQSLGDLGTVVVFIDGDSPVFDYDPALVSVSENGGLVAAVDADGKLSLPFVDAGRADSLLADAPAVSSLRTAGQAAPRMVDASQTGGG